MKLLYILISIFLLAGTLWLTTEDMFHTDEVSSVALVSTPDQLWEKQHASVIEKSPDVKKRPGSKFSHKDKEDIAVKTQEIFTTEESDQFVDPETLEIQTQYIEPPSETLIEVVTPEVEAAEAAVEPTEPYNDQYPIENEP